MRRNYLEGERLLGLDTGMGMGYQGRGTHAYLKKYIRPTPGTSLCPGHRFNSYYFLTFFSLFILEFMRYSSPSPSSSVLLLLVTVILSRTFSFLNNLHITLTLTLYLFLVSPSRVDLLSCTSHASVSFSFLYLILLKSYNIWFECNMLFSIFFDFIP
jgi:hypothetical protein